MNVLLLADAAVSAPVSPLADALNGVLVALAGVITTLLTIGGKALVDWLRTKAAAQKDSAAAALALEASAALATAASVGSRVAFENYVKAIKARKAGNGDKLTEDEAKEARRIAFDAAKSVLGPAGKALIEKGLGTEFDEALNAHIEAAHRKATAPSPR